MPTHLTPLWEQTYLFVLKGLLPHWDPCLSVGVLLAEAPRGGKLTPGNLQTHSKLGGLEMLLRRPPAGPGEATVAVSPCPSALLLPVSGGSQPLACAVCRDVPVLQDSNCYSGFAGPGDPSGLDEPCPSCRHSSPGRRGGGRRGAGQPHVLAGRGEGAEVRGASLSAEGLSRRSPSRCHRGFPWRVVLIDVVTVRSLIFRQFCSQVSSRAPLTP